MGDGEMWDALCDHDATVVCWRSVSGQRMFTVYFPTIHPATGEDLSRLTAHLSANFQVLSRPPRSRREEPPTPRRGLVTPPIPTQAKPKPRKPRGPE